MKASTLIIIAISAQNALAFAPPLYIKSTFQQAGSAITLSKTALNMARDDEDLFRSSKSARFAGANDRVVELNRPLGLVLEEDEDGNVYVGAVAPKGNAARNGGVKPGDIVTMCSATFGDQMWTTRGAGLTRVLAAIRLRAGTTVKLVFESSRENATKAQSSSKAAAAADNARAKAQAKKDTLLKQLEKDDQKLNKKFFGLF